MSPWGWEVGLQREKSHGWLLTYFLWLWPSGDFEEEVPPR